jgi:hypothetical protein
MLQSILIGEFFAEMCYILIRWIVYISDVKFGEEEPLKKFSKILCSGGLQ